MVCRLGPVKLVLLGSSSIADAQLVNFVPCRIISMGCGELEFFLSTCLNHMIFIEGPRERSGSFYSWNVFFFKIITRLKILAVKIGKMKCSVDQYLFFQSGKEREKLLSCWWSSLNGFDLLMLLDIENVCSSFAQMKMNAEVCSKVKTPNSKIALNYVH